MHGKTAVTSTLILFLTVMLVFVGPFAPVSRTYAASVNASPNPAVLGSFVTVSGSGFQRNCGPPGSGAPCIFVLIFAPGGRCGSGKFLADQPGPVGGGVGVLGFAPAQGPLFGVNLFFVTTDNNGAFSVNIFLGDTFSATNYSIEAFDEQNESCIDSFTIFLQLCVIQVGVEQPAGAVLWLPGYAYPNLPLSQCPERFEYYNDPVWDPPRIIVFHQFVQNRTFFSPPIMGIIVGDN